MTRRTLILALLAATLCAAPAAPQARRPKLLLAVVFDQFRYDYLTRFAQSYHAGFARMLANGASFTDAHFIHYPTVTAVGHSTFLSGATPALSGIIGNDWYERESGKTVTSVSDPDTKLLGAVGDREGSSPRRLLVSTVGDEIKMAGKGRKVIGISIKDRAAILPSGHMADGAYWFDGTSGNWVSSTYYFAELPEWVQEVDKARPADKYLGAEWKPVDGKTDAKPFKKMSGTADAAFYNSIDATPYGNELIESLAERALVSEKLGQHPGVDVLTVSFSSNDYVGHAVGPDAPEVRDMCLRSDLLLGKLLSFIDSRIGAGSYILVLTADHGVAPVPEVNQARKMPGGRLNPRPIADAIETALTAKYGAGKWLVNAGAMPYLNRDLIREKKLNEAEVEETAADALRALPHIARVYTREQLLNGWVTPDEIGRDVSNGFYGPRGGDLFPIQDSYWIFGAGTTGTTHSTPYNYDTHVPLVFMGPGVKPGKYNRRVALNDVAPTLATMLEVEEPSGSAGTVLEEILR